MEHSPLKRKKVAAICGANIIREISDYTKKHNLELITIHWNPNAPVHRYSDTQWYVKNTDPELVLPLLQENEVDAIISFSAEKLLRQNIKWICSSGYPFYTTQDQWDILMNKRSFKLYAAKFGIPVVPEYAVDPETLSVTEPYELPLAVKPADNGGSSGVSICYHAEEIVPAISYALSCSVSNQVLVEHFLTGSYFQFEVWMREGNVYFPYVKERIFYPQLKNYPQQPFIDIYPSDDGRLVYDALFDPVSRLLQSLGIQNGSCMFQGFIQNGIPYIMDVAFRLSGGMDFKVVKEEKQINLIDAHVQYAVEQTFGEDFSALLEPYCYTYATVSIGLKNGIISRIEGLEEISRKPWCYDHSQNYPIGYEMRQSGLFAQTGFHFFLKAENKELLKQHIREVLQLLKVEDAQGNSLILNYPDF